MSEGKEGRGEVSSTGEERGAAPSRTIAEVLAEWRARAVRAILVFVAVIGLPAWGTVIWNGIRSGQMSLVLWMYPVVYVSITALAFLPRIPHRLRIWGLLILGYVGGVASMARLGLTGSGRVYLLLMPVFATVLVGTRAGLAAAMFSLATYVVFAAQAGAAAASWIEAGVALAAFMLSTVVLLGRFSRFQMQILHRERRARSELEAAREELEAYSRTLEEKVLERTARLAEAKQQAEAANRRFEQELAFAARIQTSFMASQLPEIPSWEAAATLIPARETSGDFYDVFPLPGEAGERYGILMADVVDKGVGAALFMSLCWALLHTSARQYPDEPARVLAATNRRILRDTHADQFVTVFYGVLYPRTGELLYANGGHPPPYRLRQGQLTPLAGTGIPLGILEDEGWEEQTLDLRADDVCLFYTDGVIEAQNAEGDFFDAERLVTVLRRSAGRPAGEVKRAILEELGSFVGDVAQTDDVTLLVLAGGTTEDAEHTEKLEIGRG